MVNPIITDHAVTNSSHRIPGPVFRVSPNELSFGSVSSWKTIYGHAGAGNPTLVKSEFYEMYGAGFDTLCIGSERDPKTHSRMKRSLSAAFSTKALTEQEGIVQRCVDGFVEKLGRASSAAEGINMSHWYEMIGFDILGEMAFGEAFGCIESGIPPGDIVHKTLAKPSRQRNRTSGSS